MVLRLPFLAELEFEHASFWGEGKTGVPGKDLSQQRREPATNPHMASTPAFEPRTHLKEASALTNAPPLLPLFLSILAGNQPLHAVYLGLLQVCRTDNVSESEIKLVVVRVVRTWVDNSTEYRTFTVVFHDKGAKASCSRYTRYQSLAHGSRTLVNRRESGGMDWAWPWSYQLTC